MEGHDQNRKQVFTPHQRATVEAATARIIPTDHEPGAREARVIDYIERILAASGTEEPLSAREQKEVANFILGGPGGRTEEQQDALFRLRGSGIRARELYYEGVAELDRLAQERFGADGFRALEASKQDRILTALEERGSRFFSLLIKHTMEGFYGDPRHGGNRDRVGWAILGFPGPSFPDGYRPPLGWYDADVRDDFVAGKK